MPNTGKPSRACDACRERRAKCDLARPECSQCIRRAHLCPGYQDMADLRFFVENVSSCPFSANRDNRRRRFPRELPLSDTAVARRCRKIIARRNGTQQNYENHADSGTDLVVNCFTPFDVLRQSETMEQSPSDHSVKTNFRALVLARLVTGPDVRCRFWDVYDAIQLIIQPSEADSLVQQIYNIFSLAFIANESQMIEYFQKRDYFYQSALIAIDEALQNPLRKSLDSTLAAAWMVNIYESIFTPQMSSSGIKNKDTFWFSVILHLIRSRGREQFKRQEGRNLFWVIVSCINLRCVTMSLRPPAEVPQWLLSISEFSSNSSDQILVRTFVYVYHCTHLSSQIQAYLQANDPQILLSASPSILEEIDCLEDNVEPVTDSSIIGRNVPRPLASEPSLKPDNMDLHSILICIYFSTFRMHISSAALRFLKEATRSRACTPQQQDLFLRWQDRCLWEFWSVSERVLELVTHRTSTEPEAFLSHLRWTDTMMVVAALNIIARSQLSLSWQRKLAQDSLLLFQK